MLVSKRLIHWFLTQNLETRLGIMGNSGFGGHPRGSQAKVLEVCRKLGVSEQTFYRWIAA